MARPTGTTRAKKPIFKKEFLRLVNATKKSSSLQQDTKTKFIRAFTLLYLTGCRVSEIVDFKRSDVLEMIQNNEYSLTNNTKTNKPRLIRFDENKVQVELLKNILPDTQTYLFVKNNASSPMTRESLKYMMNTFIHSILGKLYSTHSFRAGYITTAHQVGLSVKHIKEDIGHTNVATTARYITISPDEISRGKNRIVW